MEASAKDDDDVDPSEPPGRTLGVGDFRKINLRNLIAQWGGPTALAKKLGYGGPSYLTQMVSARPNRPLTEKTARKIERQLKLPEGSMDQDPSGSSPEPAAPVSLDTELLSKVVTAIGTAATKLGVRLAPEKFADVVTLMYEDAVEKHHIDEQKIKRILGLAK